MTPNILLIVSDQHRHDCLGAAEGYPVQTPALDRLAADGALFTDAYTPIPLCTPARHALLTGRRPETTGGLWNYDLGPRIPALEPFDDAWPQRLRGAGYATQYVGKWHVSPDYDPTAFGYDEYVPLEAYANWRAEEHPDAHLPRHGWWGVTDPVPAPDSRTHWLADRTRDFIRRSSAAGRPWHARIDFVEPHLPCQPTQEFVDRFPIDAVPKWDNFDDPLIGKPYIQRQQIVNWGLESKTWEDWAPTVARYYAIIAQLDDAIGRILATLDDLGITEDTVVIYTSDHGDMCGAHGMMDKHHVMYDDVVRVPLIVRWPGRVPGGAVVDSFVSNMLDLPPTIASLGGIAPVQHAHGSDLFCASESGALIPSETVAGRSHVVSTYNGQQFGLYIQRMIRDREWKYIWNPTDIDELYDMRGDPEERHNRIDDPAVADRLSDLRRRLHDELVGFGDDMMKTEWARRQLTHGRKLGSYDALPSAVVRDDDTR